MHIVNTRWFRAVDHGPVEEGASRAEDPDADIVAQVRGGQLGPALTCLMQRHGQAVYRYCREELRDRTLADDVHQQIFLQVHRDLARFAGRATLRTWLFAIARHRVLDAAKSRRRAEVHVQHSDSADAPDPNPPPGERLDDVRLEQALVGCLGELGDHVRGPLLLRYQQGFTFEELAAIFHEKPGTLQARVMRALPIVRRCIEARTGGQV